MESLKNSAPFSELSCPRLLAQLHRSRFGGTVRIARGALLKLLYFQAGEIAMASSNDQSDHLAPILIRAGRLKPEQLELARKQSRPGTSLARVLVQMGFLTSGELFAGARQQLRQIVGSILTMTDATYELQPDYFPREITSLNVETRELLLDLVRELPERSFVLLEIGAPDSVFQPAPGFAEESARLPRAWRAIAEHFTGPLTIHEAGQLAGLDDFSASKSVYALHLMGLLEPGRAAEPAAVSIPISLAPGRSEEPAVPPDDAGEAMEEEPVILMEEPTSPEEGEEPPAPEASAGAASVSEEEPPPAWSAPVPEGAAESSSPALLSFPSRAERETIEPDPDSGEIPQPWTTAGSGEDPNPPRPAIRMEFRGAIGNAPAGGRRSSPWTALSILSGLAILAFALYWFVFLKPSAEPPRTTEAPPPAVHDAAPTPPAVAEGTPIPEATDETPEGTPSDSPGEGAPVPGPPPESSTAPAPSTESATPDTPESAAGGEPRPAPDTKPVAAEPARGSFASARSQLDAGRYPEAAVTWAGWIASQNNAGFTLQLAIACREESLRKAAAGTSGSDRFFVVPFALKGNPCYRMCWGTYPTLEAAQAARSGIPASFISEGASPVVVSFGRLVPAETR